jgi:hypothetical protein
MFIRDLPKPLPEKQINITQFSGGLNNKSPDNMLNGNESTNSQNMKFLADGLMETREGTKLEYTNPGINPITWKDKYKPINDTHLTLDASDTELFIDNIKICDVEGQVKGTNYNGSYYFVDGVGYYVYNGTTVYKIINPPTANISTIASSGQKTILISEWDERIAEDMNIQLEGINGTENATIDTIDELTLTFTVVSNLTNTYAVNDYVRFYVPRTSEYTTGLYATNNITDTKWYEPCSNELSDEFKGEPIAIDGCNIICLHDNRFYCAGMNDSPHDVFICDINNPFYFPVYVISSLNPNSDEIIDIVEFDDGVIVGRTEDIYSITGETNDTSLGSSFIQKKLDVHTGFKTINNASVGMNYLFYLGNDENIYAMNRPYSSTNVLATQILNTVVDLRNTPILAIDTDFTSCPGVFFNSEYIFKLGTKLIVYNYIYKAFTFYEGTDVCSLYTDGLKLYIGRNDVNVTVFDEDTYYDNEDDIVSRWYSKRFDCGTPINYKYFRDCFVQSFVFPNCGSTIKLIFEIDLKNVLNQIQLVNTLSYFGTMKFGDVINNRNIVQNNPCSIEEKGRMIRFLFYNDIAGERMRIYSLNTLYTMRDTR